MRGFNPFVPCTPVLMRAYRVLRATLILFTIFTVDSAFSARGRPRCVSFGSTCTAFEPSCQESITSSFRTALVTHRRVLMDRLFSLEFFCFHTHKIKYLIGLARLYTKLYAGLTSCTNYFCACLFIEFQYRKLSAPAHTAFHPGLCDYNGGQGGN